jgi:hypothetical protein
MAGNGNWKAKRMEGQFEAVFFPWSRTNSDSKDTAPKIGG